VPLGVAAFSKRRFEKKPAKPHTLQRSHAPDGQETAATAGSPDDQPQSVICAGSEMRPKTPIFTDSPRALMNLSYSKNWVSLKRGVSCHVDLLIVEALQIAAKNAALSVSFHSTVEN